MSILFNSILPDRADLLGDDELAVLTAMSSAERRAARVRGEFTERQLAAWRIHFRREDFPSPGQVYREASEAIGGGCPIEAGFLGRLADHECRCGRLAGDPTPPCGCWPEEQPQGTAAPTPAAAPAPLAQAPVVVAQSVHIDADEPVVDDTQQAITAIQELICRHFALRRAELVGPRTRGVPQRARRVALLLCNRHTDATHRQLGAAFGERSQGNVSVTLSRARRELRNDVQLQRLVDELAEQLPRPEAVA